MSVGDEDVRSSEVVIVRRRGGGGDDGHHGGVWKVAYADFMTAMMAFFLMMWLVNASNEDTRAQVASYFNPLQLSDSVTSSKGVKEMQSGQQPQQSAAGSKDDKQKDGSKESKSEDSTKGDLGDLGRDKSDADISAEELFNDPYGVLAKLASQANGGRSGFAEDKGAAFRDPFDPNFRRSEGEPYPIRSEPKGAVTKAEQDGKAGEDAKIKLAEKDATKPVNSWVPQITTTKEAAAKAKDKDKDKDKAKSKKELELAKAKSEEEKKKKQQEETVARLRKAIEGISAGQGGRAPQVELKTVSEGTLISLTDKANFAMFRSASVVPVPQVVAFFEQLGEVIAREKGEIVIAGHTDARPFRSSRYDNWRLSTDRAHIAYHMLVRGGTPEARIVRVEGHAARRPRVEADPNASANRRVEILIRRPNKT